MRQPTYVVYDGECPFCSAYVRMLRLRQAAGEVVLLNARGSHPVVDALKARDIDFDAGMTVQIGDQIYHGNEAVHWLSLMTTPSASLNGAIAWCLRDRRRARLVYPLLRAGRNLALSLLGKSRIAGNNRGGAI